MSKYGKYFKDVSQYEAIDVYRVLDLYEVEEHAIGHAIKKLLLAGSKRKVAKIAGIQNLGSLSNESVLIGNRMYRPSISTADWGKVNKELVGEL